MTAKQSGTLTFKIRVRFAKAADLVFIFFTFNFKYSLWFMCWFSLKKKKKGHVKIPNQKARKYGCVIIYGLKYNMKGFKLKTESEVFTALLEVYVLRVQASRNDTLVQCLQ